METKIIFEDDPRSECGYIAGQRLRGKVACVNNHPTELTIEGITISFEGYFSASASTSVDESGFSYSLPKRQVIYDRTDFFCIGRLLSDERRNLRFLEIAEFPFEFTVPRQSQYQHSGDAVDTLETCNGIREGLHLPPSYSSTEKLGSKFAIQAATEYNMRVAIKHSMQPVPVVVVQPVPITSVVELPSVQPQPIKLLLPVAEIQSRRLHDKSDSIADKARRLLQRSSSKPSMELQIGLQLPDNLAPAESVPLLISATSTRRGVATSQGNTLQIKSLDLVLEALDEVSVRDHVDLRRQQVRSWSFAAKDGAEIPSDGTVVMLTKNFSLPRPESVRHMAPDFTLPSFMHRHVMKVRMCIKHVESGLEFNYQQEYPFIIRPPFALLDESDNAALAREQRSILAAHEAGLAATERNTIANGNSVDDRSELPDNIANMDDEIMCLVELPGNDSFSATTPSPEEFNPFDENHDINEDAAEWPLPLRITRSSAEFDADRHRSIEIRSVSEYSVSSSDAFESDNQEDGEETKPMAKIVDLTSHYDSCDWAAAVFSPIDAELGEASIVSDRDDEFWRFSQMDSPLFSFQLLPATMEGSVQVGLAGELFNRRVELGKARRITDMRPIVLEPIFTGREEMQYMF